MSRTNWLLLLYPAAWRARYGAEFTELLLARPPSVRDRLDILRGAVDARLNPQLTEDPVLRNPTAADRLLALAGVVAGALFTVWAAIIALQSPRWGSGDVVDESLGAIAFGAGAIGMLLAVCVLLGLAARYAEELSPAGAVGAIVAALAFFFAMSGASLVALVMLTGGIVALAPSLSRIVHPLVAAALPLATIMLALAMLGFVGSEGQTTFWLIWGGGFGPAWALLGFGLRRGRRAGLVPASGHDPSASPSAAGA
jgi:hypothetical protein